MSEVKVTVTRSAGSDGAIVVFIDTDFEPGGSWHGNPGLRVNVNDDVVFEGVPYAWASGEPRTDKHATITVNTDTLEVVQ